MGPAQRLVAGCLLQVTFGHDGAPGQCLEPPIDRGDILVDEERSKLMSLPADQRPAPPPAPGRRTRAAPQPAQPARIEAPPPAPSDAPEIVPESEPIRPTIRQVGPLPGPAARSRT